MIAQTALVQVLQHREPTDPFLPGVVSGWAPPLGSRPRPIMYLLFDGGVVADGTRVRLQRDELDDYAFVWAGKGAELLDGLVADRLAAALRARHTGRTEYLPVEPAAG